MAQQGQVFKLTSSNANGDPVWAYRYRLGGRGSRRLQVGGFATRTEAQRALRRDLARLQPGGRPAMLTLAELVDDRKKVDRAQPLAEGRVDLCSWGSGLFVRSAC
jgi:hypothetical protein